MELKGEMKAIIQERLLKFLKSRRTRENTKKNNNNNNHTNTCGTRKLANKKKGQPLLQTKDDEMN